MTAKTAAERQAARRARAKAEGAAEVRGIFAPLDLHEAIKAAAARLVKKHAKAAGQGGAAG